ncbi:MAG: hypothetical protein NVV74_03130 [Magnetospirillum sp.]|nr:hypothetical protein [Magnetospirillum sp.]
MSDRRDHLRSQWRHSQWEARARRRLRRRTLVAARRTALVGLGCTCMVAGIASVPSPLPIGFVLFAMGLYFTARGSKFARRGVKWVRRVLPPFSRGLNGIKHRMPLAMRRFIERSDPRGVRARGVRAGGLNPRRGLPSTPRGRWGISASRPVRA